MAQNEFPPGLSRARALEKLDAHLGGDVSKLFDVVRKAVSFDTVENLYKALEDLQTELDIVDLEDRIARRTAMGYGDIRLHFRTSNGLVCTMRLLLGSIIEGKAGARILYEKLLCDLATARFRRPTANHGGAVLAIDMFNYMDDDSVTLITGFPSATEAREYARRRIRDSVEEMRSIQENQDNFRWLWLVYGEDCIALGPGAGETWCGQNGLESFLESPASETERDWVSLGRQFDLWAEPFALAERE